MGESSDTGEESGRSNREGLDERTALLLLTLKCVSHELGNYLSPATMMVESLLEAVEGDTRRDARDLDASIHSVAELLSALRELTLMFDGPGGAESSCDALRALPNTLRSQFPDSEALGSLAEKLRRAQARYNDSGEIRMY